MTEEKGTQSRKRKKWKKDKKKFRQRLPATLCCRLEYWWTRLVSREMAGRPQPTWCELELA